MSVAGNPSAVPLTSNGVPVRNLWYMLLYAWRQRQFIGKWQVDVENAPTLDALLAVILSRLVEQRIRIGLGRDYRKHEQMIAGVRGRIDFATSLKRLAFENGRAHCRFETFSANVPKNQIIRSTLNRLALVGEFGEQTHATQSLRHKLRRITRDLEHIDLIELSRDVVRRQRTQRDDHDYRLMLLICQLLVEQQIPTETEGANRLHRLDRRWEHVWKLFEEFVPAFLRHHVDCWIVKEQAELIWPVEQLSGLIPLMKPDIVLTHRESGNIIVVDTKFTAKSIVTGQFGNETFNRDHLFQLYAYLRSQEEVSNAHRNAQGLLLYPVVKQRLREHATVQGHTIRWETVDLGKTWPEIEQELLTLFATPAITDLG